VTEGGPGGHTQLSRYLQILARRKWVVLQSVVLVTATVILASLQQQRLYQATAQVLLSQKDLAGSLTGTQSQNYALTPDRFAQTQANLARVRTVAQRTLRAARVVGKTPGEFIASSSVSAGANNDLLTFSVNESRPEAAARLATEYARQYTIYRRELDTAAILRARSDLRARLNELKSAGAEGSRIYADLVAKDQQLTTLEALQTSNAYVVQAAQGAAQVQPQPVRNGVIGFLLGLLLGVGLAFLWETLDTRVRSAEEVAEKLDLPLLARIPAPPKRLRAENRLAMLSAPDSLEAEAFRLLRTNLDFVNLERRAKTIMITSAVEGEGKSTTAANLAVALARAGRRVVLVDLDLRRPFLDHFFNLPGAGLTEVVLGHAELDDALAAIPIGRFSANGNPMGPAGRAGSGNQGVSPHDLAEILERAVNEGRPDLVREVVDKAAAAAAEPKPVSDGVLLQVLPSGPIPPNVGEFVGMHALDDLLERLHERADVIIVDTTPLLQIGDAMTLSAKVDALVLVTRLNIVRRPMLNELRRALDSCPATKLGFVVAGAELEEGYGYGYATSYARDVEPSRSGRREPVA
jgi:succinoglycan biosynthesis transport protein ExoP